MENYKNFYLCKAADQYSLYNVGNENEAYLEPLRINASGAMIFEKLKAGQTADEIADFISSEYGIARELALKDVFSFESSLRDFGL